MCQLFINDDVDQKTFIFQKTKKKKVLAEIEQRLLSNPNTHIYGVLKIGREIKLVKPPSHDSTALDSSKLKTMK